MGRSKRWGEDCTQKVELSGGGFLTLTFRGNLFDLKHHERELIASISSIVQGYQDAAERAATAPGLAKAETQRG